MLSIIDTEIIGHEHQRKFLRKQLNENRLPHALIFSGPRSIGKSLVALELAKNFFISNLKNNRSSITNINETYINNMVSSLSYPDLYYIKPELGKKVISIEQSRGIIERLSLNTYYGLGAVIIIEGGENFSIGAANALLKSLEEPEANRLFIITTNNIQTLLPTIRSRCQNIVFGKLTEENISEILTKKAGFDKEFINNYSSFFSIEGSLSVLKASDSEKSEEEVKVEIINKEKLIAKVKEIENFASQIRNCFKDIPTDKHFSEIVNIFTKIEKEELPEISKSIGIDLVIKELRKFALSNNNQADRNNAWNYLDKLIQSKKEIQSRNLNISLQGPAAFI